MLRSPLVLFFAIALGAVSCGGDLRSTSSGDAPVCTTDADCDDGDACTGKETCDDGACHAHPLAVAIDDGDACTIDRCDPKTGEVTHERKSRCDCELDEDCDDGNACTLDVCRRNHCLHQRSPSCTRCTTTDDCEEGSFCSGQRCIALQQISASGERTCGTINDGDGLDGVFCWGAGDHGALGTGDREDRSKPSAVSGSNASSPLALSTGGESTCVATNVPSTACWGANDSGQLGLGSVGADHDQPEKLVGFNGVPVVSSTHGCGRNLQGKVSCWGDNTFRMLGSDCGAGCPSPVPVKGLEEAAIEIAVGEKHSCAILGHNQVVCWGDDQEGQHGRDPANASTAPEVVPGVTAQRIAIGRARTCIVDGSSTRVLCWGGAGSPFTPTLISMLDDGRGIAVGSDDGHVCAVFGDRVFCSGRNDHGQLGDGTTTDRDAPVQVAGVAGAFSVVAGANHTCAMSTSQKDGNIGIFCWGDNGRGQLGNGSTTPSLTATAVRGD